MAGYTDPTTAIWLTAVGAIGWLLVSGASFRGPRWSASNNFDIPWWRGRCPYFAGWVIFLLTGSITAMFSHTQ